jgi:hypothetical protein
VLLNQSFLNSRLYQVRIVFIPEKQEPCRNLKIAQPYRLSSIGRKIAQNSGGSGVRLLEVHKRSVKIARRE